MRWVVVLALLSGACGAANRQTGYGDAGVDGGPGSGGVSGGGGTSLGCVLTLEPADGWTFESPPFGENATLRIHVTGGVPSPYSWSVQYADGTWLDEEITRPQTGRIDIVEFPVRKAGSYSISVNQPGSFPVCAGATVVTTAAPAGATRSTYQARLIPPPSANYPPQTKTIQVVHGMPVAGNLFTLSKGLDVALYPVDEQGLPVTGYVRLTRKDTGDTFEAHTTNGRASLTIPSATYDILVVPDGDLPPAVYLDENGDLLDGKTLVVTAGVAVSGTVTVAGTPVQGARVVLRSDSAPWKLPSTTAVSGGNGGFTVRARPGTWALAIDPRPDSALPGVLLPESTGLSVTADQTISFDWSAPTAKSVSLTVMASGGTQVSDARVVLESISGLAAAGKLTVGSGPARQLAGHVRVEGISGSNGSLTLAGMPAAVYRATVLPPDLGSADALTVATPLDVAASSSFTVNLERKVNLSGKVVAPSGLEATTAGARVLAVDADGGLLYPAFTARVDDTSAFSMLVNPARKYSLLVLPVSFKLAGRAVLGTYQVESASMVVSDVAVPAGVVYSGLVKGERGDFVPGTTIRLYSTTNQQLVVETTAREDGSFILAVPDK